MENNVEIKYISKIETKDDNDNSDKSTKKQENDILYKYYKL